MASSPYQIFATAPSPSLFVFPPNPNPASLPPPPPGAFSTAPPFAIPEHIYQAALDPRVPITVAAAYAVTAKALNRYNTSTGKRPWAISRTRAFAAFVILHNVLLAVYSAWTFWGMLGTLRRSIVNPMGPDGWAATVDSFCRLNGAPGLGNAAYFDEASNQWFSYAQNVSMPQGLPSRAQTGRIWNEGLAFYGWIFYLSKFYEVLDTFIILAKGKLSSTLQTYHHAGAMMCMWAGMRYMSAPIWMFAFVNSGIHAMMYTYYTITAFNIRVPIVVKRTLTSMQITQFLVGITYAMSHSFVSYTIPVLVAADRHSHAGPAAAHGQAVVPCVSTSGETFAIWLNVLYLAPLTYLFGKFFVASYMRRSSAESKRSAVDYGKARRMSNVALAEKAGWDAAKDLEKEVYGDGKDRKDGRIPATRASAAAAARAAAANGHAKH